MGNHLTVESLKANLSQYSPNLAEYAEVTNSGEFTQAGIIIWQRKNEHTRLIEKKYLVRSWLQYHDILQMFAFRYNHSHLISTKFLIVENELHQVSNEGAFPQTSLRVFFQYPVTNLKYFKQIPEQDAAYFLSQSLRGFQRLVQMLGFPFSANQSMFHVTEKKEVKVWLCEQIWKSDAQNLVRPLATQNQMIHQILGIVKRNVFYKTQSQKNIAKIPDKSMQPIIIDEILRENPKSLQQTIELFERYCDSFQVEVGKDMSCLKNLTQTDLINVLQQSKRNKNQRQGSGNRLFDLNSKHKLMYAHPESTPFDPLRINRLQMHLGSPLQNNWKSKIAPHQTEHKNIILHGSPDSNCQSRELNNKISKAERSRSNKRSGLSLTRNGKGQKTCLQVKNHQSLIVIKPRPNSSIINQLNDLTAKSNQSFFPPRPSTHNPNQTFNKFINQNQRTHALIPKRSKAVAGSTNKGLSLTRRSQSMDKCDKKEILKNNQFTSDMYKKNNQSGIMVKNYSTISIPAFPTPLYANNSSMGFSQNQSFTRVGNNHSVIRIQQNKSSGNISKNLSNQVINYSSAFEPLIPNQSLTKFHKEFSNQNSSANSSGQQFFQIPKVYVHSPKPKNKIFRADTIITDPASVDEKKSIIQRQKELDMIINEDSSLDEQRKQEMGHYHSYIDQNEEIFTHPMLYEYITNDSKSIESYRKQRQLQNQLDQKDVKYENGQKRKNYIDYLANVQISESLDYHTAQKIFQAEQFERKNHCNEYKSRSHDAEGNEKNIHHKNFTMNDFPTIHQIEENHQIVQQNEKENTSFLPVPLNLNQNFINQQLSPISTVRRGYEQSVVVEYKKFHDDTNRSNNSPNKHYFSPLKVKQTNPVGQINKKYATAHNWQTSPSIPMIIRQNQVPSAIKENNGGSFKIQNQIRNPVLIQKDQTTNNRNRNNSPSPTSKLIFRGQRPSINPLLLQDMEIIRQHRMH